MRRLLIAKPTDAITSTPRSAINRRFGRPVVGGGGGGITPLPVGLDRGISMAVSGGSAARCPIFPCINPREWLIWNWNAESLAEWLPALRHIPLQ